jgi:acetyl esterase/lipase
MLRQYRLMLRALVATTAARARRGPLRPSWPFGFEVIFDFLKRDWATLWRSPPPAIRAYVDGQTRSTAAIRAVERRSEQLAGVPAEWFAPRDRPARRGVVLYFPGGSYIFGSTVSHRDPLARLTLATGLRTLALNYRRAPEHPFPAALNDALAAYRALLAQGTDPRDVVLAGESAGGNLALVTLLELVRAGAPVPRAGVLLSPWLDLSCSGASMTTNARFDWGNREMLMFQAREFAGAADLRDPRVSPFYADLSGLPPLLLQVGGCEILLDQCTALAARAAAAGVDLALDVVSEMPHAPYFFSPYAPGGARALQSIAAFVRARIGDG